MEQANQVGNQPEANGGPVRIRGRQIIKSFEGRHLGKKSFGEKMADLLVFYFGNTRFLVANAIFFLAWIILNLKIIPSFPVFDPYPFNLLTTALSLEAIWLSVLVLISQNREAKIDKLRSELDLQINLIAEQEITKILSLLTVLMERQGINVKEDPEVQRMLKKIDPWYIEKKIEEQLKFRE